MKRRVKKIGKRAAVWLYRLMTLLPLKKRLVVFNSSMGRNYTGNPRSIYEAAVEAGLDESWECVWFFRNPKGVSIPGRGKIVRYARLRFLYYMAVARVWVFDCRQLEFLIKRKGVTYIQTWHGTPLKKLALDMEHLSMGGNTDLESYRENFRKDSRTWDYLISQNPFSTETFRRCFDFHKEILEIGYPRNDILFKYNTPEHITAIRKKLGLPQGKQVLLYAPTWRDNEFYRKGEYRFSPRIDFSSLQKQLGDSCVLLVKYHYLVKDTPDWTPFQGFIYECGADADIAELFLAADMLITDYSSVMFDYSILERPMIFYCYDYKEYKDSLRGFYFDFTKKAPGPIVLNTQELIEAVKTYAVDDNRGQYEEFCRSFNPWDDGRASCKVVRLIKDLL